MSANPQPGAWQHGTMPAFDPQALPFPSHDSLAATMPMEFVDHGPMMAPVTEPAYAAPEMSDYTLITGPLDTATSAAMPADAAERALARRRLRITIAATAVVVVVAAVGFAIAWHYVAADTSKSTSTPTEQIDAGDTGMADDASTSGFGPGGADMGAMGTPPETGAGSGPQAAGAGHAMSPTGGGPGASGDIPSRNIGPMSPPIAMGGGTGAYHDAPAVQPVSGGAPVSRPKIPSRPANSPAPAGNNQGGMDAMPGMGNPPAGGAPGGAGAAPGGQVHAAATPTAAPAAVPSAQVQGQPVVTGAGANPAPAVQVIIALKTSAGAWQMYKTDPRRVVLQSAAAGYDTRGAVTGLVWLSNSWQPAVILAQPVASGAVGGGGTAAGGGPGGAPMKH